MKQGHKDLKQHMGKVQVMDGVIFKGPEVQDCLPLEGGTNR
jgi:hypothetical protein